MGILNVTPDSFSDGGTHNTPEAALAWAQQMLDEGAHMIDVGGESTRSGSAEVSVEEEAARVLPVVRALAEQGVCVSVDTRHAAVAKACVEAGAAIINDVSGFRDPAMVQVAAESDCGVVVMHMKGEPGTMQQNPQYDDVVAEVRDYLRDQAAMLEAAGVAPERICVDPGPGFGKTASQTLELVRNFQEFALPGHGCRFPQKLSGLRLRHRRPGRARPRERHRGAYGVRAGRGRCACAQRGGNREGAVRHAPVRVLGPGLQCAVGGRARRGA